MDFTEKIFRLLVKYNISFSKCHTYMYGSGQYKFIRDGKHWAVVKDSEIIESNGPVQLELFLRTYPVMRGYIKSTNHASNIRRRLMKKLLPFLFILCLPFSADAKVDDKNTNYDEYKNTESLLADISSCRAMEKKTFKSCLKARSSRFGKVSWKTISTCTIMSKNLYIQCVFDKQFKGDMESYYPYF
ncbi:MAG TPA: hypothetical protein VMX17_04735 [Candidatus Glassbacteria bacterium]|nr:hypothetical protein [Candidatus Glassbacteria bacterium]